MAAILQLVDKRLVAKAPVATHQCGQFPFVQAIQDIAQSRTRVGGAVLLAGTNDHIENHPQVTHKVSVQGVAGATRLVWVIAYFRAALLAEQCLDGRIDRKSTRLNSS